MDLLASLLSATAAIYLLASFTFAFAFARRQADKEYGVLALMCLAMLEYAAAGLFSTSAAVNAANAGALTNDVLMGEKLRLVGLIVAFAMLVHFAVRYRGIAQPQRVLLPVYGVAGLFELLDARGLLHDARAAAAPQITPHTVEAIYRGVPLSALGISLYFLGCAAVAAVLVLVARAYLAGKHEALAVVVGTTVLLATIINDVGVVTGTFSTTHLVNAGFVAFVFGASTTYSARYAASSTELDRRSRELRTRTRELRRSYEELRTAQEELVRKEQLAVVGELAAVIAHEVRTRWRSSPMPSLACERAPSRGMTARLCSQSSRRKLPASIGSSRTCCAMRAPSTCSGSTLRLASSSSERSRFSRAARASRSNSR